MEASIFLKRNDLLPIVSAVLSDVNGPLDLTTADVKFIWKNLGTQKVRTGDAVVVGDPKTGRVSYTWAAGDTKDAGTYQCEFEVSYTVGTGQNEVTTTITVPNTAYIVMVINEDLA